MGDDAHLLRELVEEMTEVLLEGWQRHAHDMDPDLARRVHQVLAKAAFVIYRCPP